MRDPLKDDELMAVAHQWSGGFPPVIEGDRVYISPNFYLERDGTDIITKRRSQEEAAK